MRWRDNKPPVIREVELPVVQGLLHALPHHSGNFIFCNYG